MNCEIWMLLNAAADSTWCNTCSKMCYPNAQRRIFKLKARVYVELQYRNTDTGYLVY